MVSAALTVGAVLLGIGRYVGNLEQRLKALEDKDVFYHGELKR